MDTVTSQDGTTIAYDKQGEGPAVIVVDGALSVHSSGGKSELAKLLAPHLTVYGYDRRGRGGSGDTLPYAVDREIEDIEALVDHAGGSAFLYGHSSGASLAMLASVKLGVKVGKLAMYEAPYNDDQEAQRTWAQYLSGLAEALGDGRRGDAVALFMQLVGTPAEQVDGMRAAPFWPGMEAVAPTLAYDHAAIQGPANSVPTDVAARVPVPALVIAGDAGIPFMPATARTLSQAMPHGQLRILEGQTHEVSAAVLAPVLAEFFAS
jgi:pimeloyl-ACP methyl ester carboxylesterase